MPWKKDYVLFCAPIECSAALDMSGHEGTGCVTCHNSNNGMWSLQNMHYMYISCRMSWDPRVSHCHVISVMEKFDMLYYVLFFLSISGLAMFRTMFQVVFQNCQEPFLYEMDICYRDNLVVNQNLICNFVFSRFT